MTSSDVPYDPEVMHLYFGGQQVNVLIYAFNCTKLCHISNLDEYLRNINQDLKIITSEFVQK